MHVCLCRDALTKSPLPLALLLAKCAAFLGEALAIAEEVTVLIAD